MTTSKGSRGADGSRRMSTLTLPSVLGAQVPALRRLRETVQESSEPKDLVTFCRRGKWCLAARCQGICGAKNRVALRRDPTVSVKLSPFQARCCHDTRTKPSVKNTKRTSKTFGRQRGFGARQSGWAKMSLGSLISPTESDSCPGTKASTVQFHQGAAVIVAREPMGNTDKCIPIGL